MVRVEELPEGATDGEVDEYLRRLCSDVTLCSPKEGFFTHYIEQIKEQVSEHFLEKFGKLKTDEERLLTTWSVKPIHTLKVQSFYKEKSREFSAARRSDGNKAYQEKRYQQALILYSQAVMRAPHNEGDTLGLAYANRSAVLSHLDHYNLALTDIQLALDAGYPQPLIFKVFDRRGHCYQQLGQHSQAREAFVSAARALSQAALDDNKKQLWQKELDRKIAACEGKVDKDKSSSQSPAEVTAKVYCGASTVLPNASSAVSLQESKEAGRFLVASRPIPAGEVVVAERPYAAVLMDNKTGTNCTHCYARLVSPVPCPTCSGVAFCSPACRDAALATYHRWECKFLDLLKGSGVSLNAYLALRIITTKGLQFFKKLQPRLQEPASTPSASSPHQPEEYLSLYHLQGLEGQRGGWDFFQRALLSSFLLKVLQRANFFGTWDDEGPPDKCIGPDEVLVGSLLLRHLQVIQFNAHELSGMSFAAGENNFKHTKSVYLGIAVYPTVAFCNHSCYPAVTRYFEGDKMVIVTLRPLSPGEVLAENYGPIFTHHSRQDRHRKLLSRYWFKCGCEACEGNWPVYDDMESNPVLRCQTCKAALPSRSHGNQSQVKCQECGAPSNVVQARKNVDLLRKMYLSGSQLMDDGKREEAIASYIRYVETVSGLVVPPLKELHLSMQAIRLLVAARGTIHTPPQPYPHTK